MEIDIEKLFQSNQLRVVRIGSRGDEMRLMFSSQAVDQPEYVICLENIVTFFDTGISASTHVRVALNKCGSYGVWVVGILGGDPEEYTEIQVTDSINIDESQLRAVAKSIFCKQATDEDRNWPG